MRGLWCGIMSYIVDSAGDKDGHTHEGGKGWKVGWLPFSPTASNI